MGQTAGQEPPPHPLPNLPLEGGGVKTFPGRFPPLQGEGEGGDGVNGKKGRRVKLPLMFQLREGKGQK